MTVEQALHRRVALLKAAKQRWEGKLKVLDCFDQEVGHLEAGYLNQDVVQMKMMLQDLIRLDRNANSTRMSEYHDLQYRLETNTADW